MGAQSQADVLPGATSKAHSRASNQVFLQSVDVVRGGRQEPFLEYPPTLSSSPVHWRGIALDNWSVPAVVFVYRLTV